MGKLSTTEPRAQTESKTDFKCPLEVEQHGDMVGTPIGPTSRNHINKTYNQVKVVFAELEDDE